MMVSEDLKFSIVCIITCTLPVYLFYRHQVHKLVSQWEEHRKTKKSQRKKIQLEALSKNEIERFVSKNRVSKFTFTSLYLISAVAYVLTYFEKQENAPTHSYKDCEMIGCVLTFVVWTNLMVSCYSTPTPPGKDRRYYSMSRSDGRVFCYLTTNIVVATWSYSVLSCYAVFSGDIRFREATHRYCPFFTSLSIIFVLLYLKFNWFNKAFVQESFMGLKNVDIVRRFSQLSLLGHVPAFSGALLDVSLKDSSTLMRTQPSMQHLLILSTFSFTP